MDRKELLDNAYMQIEKMDEIALKKYLKTIIEAYSEVKLIDFISMDFKNSEDKISEQKHIKKIPNEYVQEKLKGINEWVNLIEEGKLTIESEGCDDCYDNGYYSEVWEYSDSDRIGKKIEENLEFAENCINDFRYEDALSVMELIMDLAVTVTNDYGDEFTLGLEELVEEKIISIELKKLAIKVLYCNYIIQTKEKRAKSTYLYFKYLYFQDICVEDIFDIGREKLEDGKYFWDDWIKCLMGKKGDVEARLLKDAILYHMGTDGLLIKARVGYSNHPSLYLLAINEYEKKREYKKIMEIGKEALDKININMVIRSEIALKTSLAAYHIGDEKFMQECWYEAYDSNTTIVNYLRLFTTQDSICKYKESANKKLNYKLNTSGYQVVNKELLENAITMYDHNFLYFFAGEFDKVKKICANPKNSLGWSNKFIEDGIKLFLLYLYEGKKLESGMKKIVTQLSQRTGFGDSAELLFMDKKDMKDSIIAKKNKMILWEIMKGWKIEYPMSDVKKSNYLIWIEKIIDERTQAIVSNTHRSKYESVALLIASLGEVKESLGEISAKELLIGKYQKMFPRHSSFRGDLNEYK